MKMSVVQTCPRADGVPPLLGGHNLERQVGQIITVFQNCGPVSSAEQVTSVEDGINNKYSVRNIWKNVKCSRGQQRNSRFFRFSEGREVITRMEKLAPVIPNLEEPVLQCLRSTGIPRRDHFVIGVRRDCQLPTGSLASAEDTLKRFYICPHSVAYTRSRFNKLMNALAVIEDEIDRACVQEYPSGWWHCLMYIHLYNPIHADAVNVYIRGDYR